MKNKVTKPQAARSLTATLAIAFLALSVVVLLISGGLQLFSSIQTQQATIAGQQQLIAQDASRTVSSFIQDKFSTLATAVQLTNLTSVSPTEQRQILEGLLGRDMAFRQSVLFNVQDQEQARVSRLSKAAAGQLPDRLTGEALTQIKQGKNYIGPVYIDPNSSEPQVLMAIPATDALGNSQGTLAAEVNLKFMWDLVDQLKVGETGLAYVVDRQGNLIAFRDTARVLKGENVGQLKTVSDFIHNPAPAPTTRVSTYQGIQGDTVVGTYVPLGTPDWAVVTEVPWAEAYQGVIRNAAASAGVILVMAALAGLVGAYLARRLAVPLVNLTGTATRIAGGEMELQAAAGGPREVASLATAFNSMTQQLRSFIGSLEQRVEERTRELARRSNYLEVTARVARDVAETLELQDLLSRVVNLVSEQFGFYHTGIFLMDASGEWAELKAASSAGGKRMLERGHRLRAEDKGIVGAVAHRGQSRIALDTGADAVFLQNPDLPDTRSEMALPLRVRGRAGRGAGGGVNSDIIGVLDVQSTVPQAFSNEDAAVLQTLADQVALAISNARLFQQAQASLEAERKAYGELSRTAWLNLLRTRSDLGYRYEQHKVMPVGEVVAKAVQPDEKLAELTLPVKYRDQTIGTIVAHKDTSASEWTSEEITLIEALADQLSMALDSARLYQDTQRRAARERILREVTARVRSSTDPETVLRLLLREVGTVLNRETFVRLGSAEQLAQPGEQTLATPPARGNPSSAEGGK